MAKYLMIEWVVASISVFGSAEIVVGPQDTEAKVEETVELHCKGSLGNLEWQHLAIGASDAEHVFQDGIVFEGYNDRINVSITNDGTSVLNIRNVKPSDAGTFICLENSETPSQKAAQLIVLESFPSNKSCANKCTCKSISNSLKLSCEMKAHGNHIPSMQWIDRDGNSISAENNTVNEMVVSTVTLKSNPDISVSYTCRLHYETIPLISKYNWTYSTSDWEPPKQPSESSCILEISCATWFGLVAFALIEGALIAGAIIVTTYIKCKNKHNGTIKESEHLIQKTADVAGNAVTTKFTPCTTVNKGNPIHGLAAIDDEVFIITRDGRFVEVFDLHGGEWKRSWQVDGLISPNDMAACPDKKIIFICDWITGTEKCEIFCLNTDGKLFCRWYTENHMDRISITKECNVLVINAWYDTIKEFSSTGRWIKTIRTGKDRLHIWHAAKLDNETFVFGFGDTDDFHREIHVCTVDYEGKIIKTIRSGSELFHQKPLSVPRALAVDKKGNVYVCDLYNFRIILLNSELKLRHILNATSDGDDLRGPLRICVHHFNNKNWLLVADSIKEFEGKRNIWRNGHVAVWNLQEGLLESVSEA